MSRLLDVAKGLADAFGKNVLLTDEQIDALNAWHQFADREKACAPYQEILELWQRKCPELVQPHSLDGVRKGALDRFWRKFPTKEEIEEIFDMVAASPLLMGKVSKWRADLWWVIKPANLQNIIDGRYDERANPVRQSRY